MSSMELIKKLREDLLEDIVLLKYNFFTTRDAGNIQNTLTSEVERIQLAYMYYFQSFEQGMLILVYVGFAFTIDPFFAIIVSVGGVVTNIFYKTLYKITKQTSNEFTDDNNKFQGEIIELVSNYKYLKATGLINNFKYFIYDSIKKIELKRKKIGLINALLTALREPILMLVVVSVIIIQIKVLEGKLGPILVALLFFYRALNSLTTLQNYWNRFLGVSGSINNQKTFEEDVYLNKELNIASNYTGFKKEIYLSNISFSYEKTRIISNLNLKISKNEVIAFVGESGSGKTTIVNLICGLLDNFQGEILFDKININSIDKNSLRKKIGYITQEPVIFTDTIFNNVTFWSKKNEHTLKKFSKVIDQVDLRDLINDLPEKEDTLLGINGAKLSGGQKQRISIAREIYKDIEILIMDEATSAIDNQTEKSIKDSISNLIGGITIIMIAHRLSTIDIADKIFLIEKGKIKYEGNFENLKINFPEIF